jgi:aldose 1-epimerase
MQVRRETVGTTVGHPLQPGQVVYGYTLDSGAGLSVTVWTYGATLVEVRVPDRLGEIANIVLRLPTVGDYEDRARNPYLGATVGRYARCISNGRFQLDGNLFEVDRNERQRHHIHGGSFGFDRFVWDADAESGSGEGRLRLRLERPDGDQGYPGAVSAETMYRVDSEGRLSFEHRATTNRSTVVDITNHACWNLNARAMIDGHELAINATDALMVDSELIPVGLPVPVAATDYDFQTPRAIARTRLDTCYALKDHAWAARLHDPVSGRSMRIVTDQPGLQVYSGDGLAAPRSGICLQTGSWPDSPNHPQYPSVRLDPGEVYIHRTAHEFG